MGMTTERLLRIQVLSGLVFSAFLAFHLFNQALAVLGPDTYNGAQGAFRVAYQAPVLELLGVVVPLLVHMAVGVVRVARGFRQPAGSWRQRLHRYSGRFLLLVVVGHMVATRGPSLLKGVFPGFEGVGFTFQFMPAYFWPYYTLLALSGWYHLVHGLSTAATTLRWNRLTALSRPVVFRSVVGLGCVALVAGIVRFGVDPRDLMNGPYARLVLDFVGR